MSQEDKKTFPLLIASDHAGFDLKKKLLEEKQFFWKDLGCFSPERTDYPDWADKLCQNLKLNLAHSDSPAGDSSLTGSKPSKKIYSEPIYSEPKGVLICGSGQGMAIRANRYQHIRASLCWNEEIAFLAGSHNQANVLCLPGKFMDKNQALGILNVFLKTKLKTDPAYKRRVKKLSV